MSKNFVDVLVLILLAILATVYAFITKDTYFGKSLIVGAAYMVPPVVYLGIRRKKNWRKVLGATTLFGLLWGFAFAFVAEFTLSWEVLSTIIPGKIFGIHTFDTTIGIMLMTLLTVVFYEHFIDQESVKKKVSARLIPSLFFSFIIVLIILGIFFFQPSLFIEQYAYSILGVAAIIPPIILAIFKPSLIKKMAITGIYFFFLYFVIELFAVAYDWWVYPGSYIGTVTVFNLSFPFEELFFWMMFYAASVVSYYEILIDDGR